jgi:hypothetical protein
MFRVIIGRIMIMGQNLNKIESMYDALAIEYAEAFSGEHKKEGSSLFHVGRGVEVERATR